MKKVFMLAFANIRKNKGQAVSLLIFVLIAAALLNLGLVLLFDYGKSFEERAGKLNAPHVSILQTADITTEEQMTYLKDYPGVTDIEKQEVITGFGDYYMNDAKATVVIVFANAESVQKMNGLSLIGESKPLDSNGIYVPYMMKSAGGYELGDDYYMNLSAEELCFSIAGFTEEISYGSVMMNIYRFYVSDEMYTLLSDRFPDCKGFLQSARLGKNDDGVQIGLDYSKEFFFSEDSGSADSYYDILSFAVVKSTRIFIPMIMSVAVIAFAVILLAVCLIVIRFRIINGIEEDITNVGALKAIGYKSGQIISSIVLQFASIVLAGGAAGLLISRLFLPILAGILETQSAVIWKPGFNPVPAIAAFLTVLISVMLVTYTIARRIRKLLPLTALRSGMEPHNFKKNSMPLEKTYGPLPFLLACKQLLQNKKQAATIAVIIAVVSFASIAGISVYYNIGIQPDAFTSVIMGEKPDVGLLFKNGKETTRVMERINEMENVRKAFGYDQVFLRAQDYNVAVWIAEDFSQLEGNMLITGRYPVHENEIALNGIFSGTLNKKIGDKVAVKQGGSEREFLIVGIIQMANNNGLNLIMTLDGLRTIQNDYEFKQLYIYLDDGNEADSFIGSIESEYGEIINNTVNISELIEAQFGSYGGIFGALAAGLLAVTAMVVVLVLYMVIKAMILRKKRELGIQKALGFTTLQLMTQIALSFTPVVLIGVVMGGLGGYFGFNPIFTLTVRSMGIMQVDMPSPVIWTVLTCASLTILAYLVCMLIALRIRRISAYTLVSE